MFKNFFRRRKKKQEVVKEKKKKTRDAFAAASSVGELLSIGKDVRVISVMFPDVKLGVKFLKGEVGMLSDEARKLGISEGTFTFFFPPYTIKHARTQIGVCGCGLRNDFP